MSKTISVLNKTYYNTDDITKLVREVYEEVEHHSYCPSTVRVQYLGKAQEYHEGSASRSWYGNRGHQFSLQAKGWGEVLAIGEAPRASASRARDDHKVVILSIARKGNMFGNDELQKLGASRLVNIPDVGVRDIVFALLVQMDETDQYESLEEKGFCKKVVRIGDRIAKVDQLRASVAKESAKVEEVRSRIARTEWDLAYHQEEVVKVTEALEKLRAFLVKAESSLASSKSKLAKEQAAEILTAEGERDDT